MSISQPLSERLRTFGSTPLRFRFRIRTLLVAFLLLALLLTAGPVVYFRVTTLPLGRAVAGLNANIADSLGKSGSGNAWLTEAQVLQQMRQVLAASDASSEVKQYLARLLESERLPRSANFLVTAYENSATKKLVVTDIHVMLFLPEDRTYKLFPYTDRTSRASSFDRWNVMTFGVDDYFCSPEKTWGEIGSRTNCKTYAEKPDASAFRLIQSAAGR
jgi:hypothetical protein